MSAVLRIGIRWSVDVREAAKSVALAVSVFLTFLINGEVLAWGGAHFAMTGAAFEVQPQAFRESWSVPHRCPVEGIENSLSWFLTNRFTMHPDAVDGPCRTPEELPRRLRATRFVYGERDGKFFPPIAWSDPEKASKGPRPKTYHYFTLRTEELNRIFAEKGARWYFEKIRDAMVEGRQVDAAEYLGAFAHAIEDRVSPFHVWDGYGESREKLESRFPVLQSPEGSRNNQPANTSSIWALGGEGIEVNLEDYQPLILGKTTEEASRVFTERLFQSRAFAESVYAEPEGFIRVRLQEDWKNRKAGEATKQILSRVAEENSRLVADVMRTAWFFSLPSR